MKKRMAFLLFLLLFFIQLSYAQTADSSKYPVNISGSVKVTNNGISIIPTFSLGKPAAVFDLSVGKRLTFDPELRFSLEGKPWSFLFWGRYKLISDEKFHFNVGTHLAISFKNFPISTNPASNESIVGQRFVAAELTPNYSLSRKVTIGFYYLYAYGFDNVDVRNTNYLALNIRFSDIKISNQYYLVFVPQIYYLRINNDNGANFTASLTLAKINFPLSISGFINKEILHIPGGKNILWNVTLVYSFGNMYQKLK